MQKRSCEEASGVPLQAAKLRRLYSANHVVTAEVASEKHRGWMQEVVSAVEETVKLLENTDKNAAPEDYRPTSPSYSPTSPEYDPCDAETDVDEEECVPYEPALRMCVGCGLVWDGCAQCMGGEERCGETVAVEL